MKYDEKSIRYINEIKASSMLGFSVQTLRNWRHLGYGPRYLKVGRSVRYSMEDLITFMENGRVEKQGGKGDE